jgi:ABC-type Mn2+/Zn2+ transport system ATPase subunit
VATDLIRLRGVRLAYGARIVLDAVDLDLARGDFLGVMGPNGSGKTTLLKALLGLLAPSAGTIELMPLGDGRAPRFGYVPQRERLDPHYPLSALDVALMGRYGLIGPLRRPGRQDVAATVACLERVKVADHARAPFRELSGGLQQRVLIARALTGEPDVLLLDEPTNGMDLEAERAIMELLLELQRERGVTIVFVTHLLGAVQGYARTVALIARNGRLITGPKSEMLSAESLAHAYAASVG